MKIAFIGPVPPIRGGIAQHSARVVAALRDEGHEVDVVSWARQFPRALYKRDERDPGAEPFPGARFSLRWSSPASWLRAGRRARRADLVVFPWVSPLIAPAWRVILGAASPTPAVAIVHNPLPHERRSLDRPLTAWALRRMAGAVVHGEGSAQILASIVGPVRTIVVPHPPNLPIEPSPLPPSPPLRLVFLGFVRPYKGLDTALDAVASLLAAGEQVTLTVAGEFWGPVEPWRARLREQGLEGVVTLLPRYVPDAEIPSLLAAHHLVVAPYRDATQSGVVPLAYAAGRPVVATAVGSLPEVVTDGVTGALSPPGDAAAFAEAIRRAAAGMQRASAAVPSLVPSWRDVARAVVEAAGR